MANETWSQKPLITEISNTTEFCILDEAIPKNKRINAKALLDAKANSSTLSSHTSNTNNPHSVTKTQIGLGDVDNTSDANKPISIAQQTALDLKAPKENAAFTGNMTLNGYPVSTNDLNGTNYLMVYGTGTPAENAAELNAAISESEKMPRYLGIISSNTPIQMYKDQIYSIFIGYYIYEKVIEDRIFNPFNPSGNTVRVDESEAKATQTTIIVAPSIINGTITPIPSGVKLISLTGFHDVIINGVKSLGRNDIYDKSQTDILLSRKQDLLNSFNKLGRWNGDINTVYFYLDLVGHLQYANFITKTISGVRLSNINFKYANFTSGTLNNSYFNKSNFSYATFRNAALTNVDLTEANLTNANLTGIILSGVRLDRVNLSGATGLNADINIALTPDKYLLTNDTYLIWTDGKPYNIATGLLVYAPQFNDYAYSIIGEI